MCFFKKKDKVAIATEDKHDLQAAYARAKHIEALADAGSETAARLEALATELKYCPPSSKPEVVKLDTKIENAVEDLRAMVVGKKDEEKILAEIKEVDAMIVYRKALLETEI